MVRDAESHGEEDRRKRREAEIRNEAASQIYTTEKALAEAGNTLDPSETVAVVEALADLRRVAENGTADEIERAVSRLHVAAAAMREALIAKQAAGASGQPNGAGAAGAGAGAGDQATAGAASGARRGGGGDDVLDAEFKET